MVKANQAISFLKAHTKDDEFEIEAATSAILKAISYLEQFEKELLEIMIDAIAKDERKKELSKIEEDDVRSVLVSMELNSNEEEYLIQRSFTFTKQEDGLPKIGEDEFIIEYKLNNGERIQRRDEQFF